MVSYVQAPPTSPRRESSSLSDIRTPTLSKAPRRSFLSRVPSLLMSINLKQSLYIWSCSSEKPPSFWPLPILFGFYRLLRQIGAYSFVVVVLLLSDVDSPC